MRRITAYGLLAVAAAGVITTAGTADAASYTPSTYASRLLQLTNQARAEHGLAALTLASGTSTVAASWTSHLASAHALSHNPNLASDIESHGSPDWTDLGENVGDGGVGNPDALFNAYMASPEHRANILEPGYRYVGVGVVFTGNTAWNTFDFVDTYGTTRTTKPAPKPTHTATSSGTTAPATTTTSTHAPAAASAPAAPAAPAAPQPAASAQAARHPAPAAKHDTHARPAEPRIVRVVVNDPVPSYLFRAAPVAQANAAGALSADDRRPLVLALAVAMLMLASGAWLTRPRRA